MDHAKILESLATAIREKENWSFVNAVFLYNKALTRQDAERLSKMTLRDFWDDYLRGNK